MVLHQIPALVMHHQLVHQVFLPVPQMGSLKVNQDMMVVVVVPVVVDIQMTLPGVAEVVVV